MCPRLLILYGGGAVSKKHDGPSDRVTDHSAMDKQHGTMVRHPVGRSVVRIETAIHLVRAQKNAYFLDPPVRIRIRIIGGQL